MSKRPILSSVAVLALACAASASHATLVFYSTQASFLAASSGTSVDTFTGATLGISRDVTHAIGSSGVGYNASERSTNPGSTNTSVFYSGTAANPSLSTYFYGAQLVIDDFSNSAGAPVQAIGGNFYDVGSSYTFTPGSLTLTALDSDGTIAVLTINESNSRANTFFGVVSTATLVSLTLTPGVQGNQSPYKATVDNLTLGGIAAPARAVPEPASSALVLTAIGALGAVARRRRSPTARRPLQTF